MTHEEAIRVLNDLHDRCCSDVDGKRCDALDLAMNALEKQIPTKPINEPINQSLHYKLCPRCRKKISDLEWKQEYCWKCGQAIKWTEGEG